MQVMRRLAAFAILTACLDFLMPEGKSRGYVRFAAGLILLDAVAFPMIRFLTEVL